MGAPCPSHPGEASPSLCRSARGAAGRGFLTAAVRAEPGRTRTHLAGRRRAARLLLAPRPVQIAPADNPPRLPISFVRARRWDIQSWPERHAAHPVRWKVRPFLQVKVTCPLIVVRLLKGAQLPILLLKIGINYLHCESGGWYADRPHKAHNYLTGAPTHADTTHNHFTGAPTHGLTFQMSSRERSPSRDRLK